MTRTRRALYLVHGIQPTRFLAELDSALSTRTAPEIATEFALEFASVTSPSMQ